MRFLKFPILFFLLICLFQTRVNAQTSSFSGQQNPIMTAVPFLMIAPDARSGAMGDAGVSSNPDANSMHWNPAKLAYVDKDMGASVSYSPWLHKLVPDISLAYLAVYKRINKAQTIGASLRYFNLGSLDFTDVQGSKVGTFNPNEFALDATYSRFLTKTLTMAVSARYIHSNLTQGQYAEGTATKAGNSVAADIAVYQQFEVKVNDIPGKFAWGVNLSNLGAKISYSDANLRKDFLPTNLRFGPSLTLDFDDYNSMTFMLDINKLLVPTQPYWKNGDTIESGMDPNVSPVVGLIHSFYDAPGGFSEEMKELSFAGGLEYWYDKQFALRGGFFYEDKNKGNRKFVTLGAGLRFNVFGLDFSYLIPVQQENPLANTLRFSLLFNLDNTGK